MANCKCDEAVPLRDSGAGVALARIAQGPLIYALEQGKLRLVYFGFDLLHPICRCAWRFRFCFTIFLSGSSRSVWSFPARAGGRARRLRLPPAQFSSEALITMPSGKTRNLSRHGRFAGLRRHLRGWLLSLQERPSVKAEFAVNLLDEDESQIAPRLNANSSTRKNDATVATARADCLCGRCLLGAVLSFARARTLVGLPPGLVDLSDSHPRRGAGGARCGAAQSALVSADRSARCDFRRRSVAQRRPGGTRKGARGSGSCRRLEKTRRLALD